MITQLLHRAADNGRILLVVGLVAGIGLPDLAHLMRDYLGYVIALLLFLNAFRIGTNATLGTSTQLKQSILLVLVLQLIVPCALLLIFAMLGIEGPIATALIIMTSAASITGSVNVTILLGHEPSASQRLLILGTAMLPLTILPVFYLSPNLGDTGLMITTALRLLAVIIASAGSAYIIRAVFFKNVTERQIKSVDGFSVFIMAVLVIGLMSALGPALFVEPLRVLFVLLIAFAANLSLQIGCYLFLRSDSMKTDRVGISVVAGNRNMALFLAALPLSITEPILLYIACYQLPMYLTPILLKKFYAAN